MAYKIFSRPSESLVKELSKQFYLKSKISDSLFKFEHIILTGGSNINDLLRRALSAEQFKIPAYTDIWVGPRNPKTYHTKSSLKVLSAHYLNGANVESSKDVKSFTFIRDPRKVIISSLQNGETIKTGRLEFWKLVEKKLIKIKKRFGHLNYQLYEIAFKNSEKRFPYIHGGSKPLFNIENLLGTHSEQLYELVNKRLEDDLVFIGITENFSESAVLLFEKLGISTLDLWRPGLFAYRKYTFEEAPLSVQDLIEELCEIEMGFYRYCKNYLMKLSAQSVNSKIITRYIEQNKRPDIKFILAMQERLELADANNDDKGLRLISELDYVTKITNELQNLINSYE